MGSLEEHMLCLKGRQLDKVGKCTQIRLQSSTCIGNGLAGFGLNLVVQAAQRRKSPRTS